MDKWIKKTGFLQEFLEPLMFTLSPEESGYNTFQFPNIFDHKRFCGGAPYRTSVPRVYSPVLYLLSQTQILSCLLSRSLPANWRPLIPHLDFWNRILNWSPCFQTRLPPIHLYVPDIHQGIISLMWELPLELPAWLAHSSPPSRFPLTGFSAQQASGPRGLYSFTLLPVPGQILKHLQAQPHILPPPWNLPGSSVAEKGGRLEDHTYEFTSKQQQY